MILDLCGYPLCPNPLPSPNNRRRKGRYRVSLSEHKVYDLQETHMYCCKECLIGSRSYTESLSDERRAEIEEKVEEVLRLFGYFDEGKERGRGDLMNSKLEIKEKENVKFGDVKFDEWFGASNVIKGYVPQHNRGYFVEATWAREGYTPTLQEYLRINSGYPLLICITPMLNGEEMPMDVLDWVLKLPKIVEASSKIGRLMDDLVTTEFEQQRMHVASSVQCYMNEHGVTEQEARVEINKMVANAWKDMNSGLIDPCPFKKHLNMLGIDYSRVMELLYKYEDVFTNPSGDTRKNIAAVLVHPVSY